MTPHTTTPSGTHPMAHHPSEAPKENINPPKLSAGTSYINDGGLLRGATASFIVPESRLDITGSLASGIFDGVNQDALAGNFYCKIEGSTERQLAVTLVSVDTAPALGERREIKLSVDLSQVLSGEIIEFGERPSSTGLLRRSR